MAASGRQFQFPDTARNGRHNHRLGYSNRHGHGPWYVHGYLLRYRDRN
jgi:hypothetical protein